MKNQFRIEQLGRSFKERLGIWSTEKKSVKTPAVWIATQGGAIPNLTPETIRYLTSNAKFAGLLIPFQYHTRDVEVLEKFKKGIDAFMGLAPQQWNILVAPQDPGVDLRLGYHTNKDISLWDSTGNRVPVNFAFYNRAIHAMRPDAYVPLCDGETPKDCPKKRVAKATAKSLSFLDQHLEKTCYKENSDINVDPPSHTKKDSLIFGAVEGGFDVEARKVSAKQVAERPVDGFLIDGFCFKIEQAIKLNYEEDIDKVVSEGVIPNLPEDKLRLYFGICSPKIVVKLVSEGVDMFDTSYARYATEQGQALVFQNTLENPQDASNILLNESLITDNIDESDEKCCDNADFIDLKDPKFKNDFRPVSETCICYTCRKHTRAYVNHLLATNEMLAPVLLTIHNLHHYATFFETIQKSIQNESFHRLTKIFM